MCTRESPNLIDQPTESITADDVVGHDSSYKVERSPAVAAVGGPTGASGPVAAGACAEQRGGQ